MQTRVASINSASRCGGVATPFSGPKDIATFTKREDGRRNLRSRMKFMSSNNKDLSDSVNFPAGDELKGTMGSNKQPRFPKLHGEETDL